MLPFLSMRALEQVRTDVCYPNLPVKIIGTHGGLVGNGGSTHYAVEDLALMCALTNMTVTSIGDPLMVGEILRQSMTMTGPLYIRLAVGKKDKVLYEQGEHDIRIGKGIVAARAPTPRSSRTARLSRRRWMPPTSCERDGRSRSASWTCSPSSRSTRSSSLSAPRDRRQVRRARGHLAYGGLASRVADVLADRGIHLAAFERLGIPQVYAGFGDDEELRDKHGYGLSATIAATRRVIAAATDPPTHHSLNGETNENSRSHQIGSLRDPDESRAA
jgi:transketolase